MQKNVIFFVVISQILACKEIVVDNFLIVQIFSVVRWYYIYRRRTKYETR